MQSTHAIVHGFPITEDELGAALIRHLEGNPNTPWSWNSYSPAELIEDDGAVTVYREALGHGLFTPQYGPLAVDIISLENGEGEYTLIAASEVNVVNPEEISSMEVPGKASDTALENFADFLGLKTLPEFKLHWGILEDGQ